MVLAVHGFYHDETNEGTVRWYFAPFTGTNKPGVLSSVYGIEIIPDGTDLHVVAASTGLKSVMARVV